MAEKVVSQVTFEIGQIDQLLVAYADLWERAQQGTPDLVELTALASVLHSFYNGLENILDFSLYACTQRTTSFDPGVIYARR